MLAKRLIRFLSDGEDTDCLPDNLCYSWPKGGFFLFNPDEPTDVHPLQCRDEFAWEWEGVDEPDDECGSSALGDDGNHRWIGFVLGPYNDIDIERLNVIWKRLECKMSVGPGLKHSGTVFYRTDAPGTIVLHLSPFWVQSSTHRSVFTLLLRMIVCYPADTLNQMIESYHHARACSVALKRFLAGYTKPTYDRWNDKHRLWQEKWDEIGHNEDEEPDDLSDTDQHLGVVAEFTDRPLAEIRRKLVKP